MSIKIDINNCRVCLQSDKGQPLFSDAGQYAQKYIYTTQLKATKGDGLPELICSMCIARLKIAYEFRKQSEASEQNLRQLLDALNAKSDNGHGATDDEAADMEARLLAEALADFDENIVEVPAVMPPPTMMPPPVAPSPRPAEKKRVVPVAVQRAKPQPPTTAQRQSARTARKQLQELLQPKMEPKHEHPADDGDEAADAADAANAVADEEPHEDEQVADAADAATPSENGDGVLLGEFIITTPGDDELLMDEEEDMNEEHLLEEMETTIDEESSLLHEMSEMGDDNDHNAEDDDDDDDDIDDKLSVLSAPAPPKKRRRAAAANTAAAPAKRRAPSRSSSAVGGVHVCLQCNKDFSTRTNLLRHIQTHDGSKPYKCTICDSAFTQNGSLKQHMHIHTGLRPFTCEFCDRGFTQSKSLTFHMRRHTGEKPFTCNECGLSFRQKDGLKRHAAVRHPDGDKLEFPCDQCPKVMRSRYSLSVHKRRHAGEVSVAVAKAEAHVGGGPALQFQCEQCPRTFGSQASLVAHRRQHSSDRENVDARCPQCDVVCGSKALLAGHLRTVHREGAAETDEDLLPELPRPYGCKECELSFVQEAHLTVHWKAVHGKRCKKFQCTRCTKGYAIKANLDAHMARHESHDLMDSAEFDESVEQLEMYDEEEHEEYEHHDINENSGGDVHQEEIVTGDPLHSVETKPIFECGDCTIGFTTTMALVQHRRDEHGVEEMEDETSMCETCDLVFQDVGELEAHIVMAHGDQMVTLGELEVAESGVTVVAEEETESEVAEVAQTTETTDEDGATVATEVVAEQEEKTRFECERCDKQLDTQKALDEHVLEHDLTDGK